MSFGILTVFFLTYSKTIFACLSVLIIQNIIKLIWSHCSFYFSKIYFLAEKCVEYIVKITPTPAIQRKHTNVHEATIVIIIKDITERKRVRERAREQQVFELRKEFIKK